MDRKKILIIDQDPNDVSDLRKALVAAGYDVKIIISSTEALPQLESFRPHLLISEVRLPVMDGPHLLQEIRKRPSTQNLPFVMIGRLPTVDERVNVMRLALDDYLQKPLDIDETVVRLENLIKETELLSSAPQPRWRGFNGNLSEMNLIDLLQTLEVGGKTCVVRLRSDGKEGAAYLVEGQVIDAELEELEARRALLRMFTWNEGSFQVELQPHERARMLTIATRDLISEGMTRHYRWGQLAGQLPPLSLVLMPSPNARLERLDEEEEQVLQQIESQPPKRIIDVIATLKADELRTLTVIKNLYERGTVRVVTLPAEQKGDEYFERLKSLRSSRNGAPDPGAMLELMVSPFDEQARHQPDRRRVERRMLPDRRQVDRRRGASARDKNKIYLNKSELFMIREKLAR